MATTTESPLGPERVHLWWATDRGLNTQRLKELYLEWLTEEEKTRYGRYMFQKDADLYLLTRALCRKVLCEYADVEPSAWRFQSNHYGKPSIEFPETARHLEFNLTNTPGFVACMVSDRYAVGVDAEAIDRKSTTLDIAKRFFSAQEFEELKTHPEHARTARFFHYWTLKEAYIKVRGMGMSIPLADFSMVEDVNGQIQVVHHTSGEHTKYHWYFEQGQLAENYIVGMSVKLEEPGKPDILIREMPLA